MKQYTYSFDKIKYLGLTSWIDAEASGKTFWWIYMRLIDDGYLKLSIDTEDYSSSDVALQCLSEATKIRQSDFNFV